MRTKIKDLPKENQPREKMFLLGADSLSHAELISIILGIGTKKEDVQSIATRVFPPYTPAITPLFIHPELLMLSLHIPQTHACKIAAVFELAKRINTSYGETYIHTPHDVFSRVEYIRKYNKEYLVGIYLNARNMIIHEEVIAIGSLESVYLSPKEIIKPGINKDAAYLIIAHNHPSGSPEPSKEDILATKRLYSACIIMGLPLSDHIIIGKNSYFSFADKQMLK